MRKIKNITVAIPADLYRQARVHVAMRGMSLSFAVRYLLQHLPLVDEAVRRILADPDFVDPALPGNAQKTRSGKPAVKL